MADAATWCSYSSHDRIAVADEFKGHELRVTHVQNQTYEYCSREMPHLFLFIYSSRGAFLRKRAAGSMILGLSLKKPRGARGLVLLRNRPRDDTGASSWIHAILFCFFRPSCLLFRCSSFSETPRLHFKIASDINSPKSREKGGGIYHYWRDYAVIPENPRSLPEVNVFCIKSFDVLRLL